jgi:hypothetical protein
MVTWGYYSFTSDAIQRQRPRRFKACTKLLGYDETLVLSIGITTAYPTLMSRQGDGIVCAGKMGD